MQSTTALYDVAVFDTVRETKGRVSFEIVDITDDTGSTVSVTSEEVFSDKEQMFDGIREMPAYATFEPDLWLLDGSFVLPPKPSELSTLQVGWWSSDFSGAGGTFAIPQVIERLWNSDKTSIGLEITFDVLADEYAVDFVIQLYDSGLSLIYTDTVVGNTLSKYIWTEQLTEYRKAIITITKWKSENRRARITEIDKGIVYVYGDEKLTSLSIIEEIDPTSTSTPSNEITINIEDLAKDFNLLNPTGIYAFLQKRQKIKAEIAVAVVPGVYEYISVGQFFLYDWKRDGLNAILIARDSLDVMSRESFTGKSWTGTESLKNVAEEMLTTLEITDYELDVSLSSVVVGDFPYGELPDSDYRVALQKVAMAAKCILNIDRNGKTLIEKLEDSSSGYSVLLKDSLEHPVISNTTTVNTVILNYKNGSVTYVDPAKLSYEKTDDVTFDNTLIYDATYAESVAKWLLGELQKKLTYDLQWRQNPAYEAKDIVTIEDEFMVNKNVRLVRQSFEYDGILQGTSIGKVGG